MNEITLDEILPRIMQAPKRQRTEALLAAERALKGIPPLAVNQAEAARMLSVSRHTIRRMVEGGELHPVSLRGLKRFSVVELTSLLQPETNNKE